MPSKTPSPVYQVNSLFQDFLATGESRHEAKRELIANGQSPQAMGSKIHSWGTFKRVCEGAIMFARWCKAEYGMKYLSDIRPEWTQRYIELRKGSVAPNTVSADLTAIRRLDKCLQAKGLIAEKIVPKGLRAPRGASSRGAYAVGDVRAIIQEVAKRDPLAADVLRVQWSGGLRLREAIALRSDRIELRVGVISVLGKGGKERRVELHDRRVLDRLDLRERFPLRPGRDEMGFRPKEESWMRDVQGYVRSACRRLGITPRGTHAIRAAAARVHYHALVIGGMSKYAALDVTAHWLGHGPGRLDVLRRYLGDALVDDALGDATRREE